MPLPSSIPEYVISSDISEKDPLNVSGTSSVPLTLLDSLVIISEDADKSEIRCFMNALTSVPPTSAKVDSNAYSTFTCIVAMI